MYADADTGIRVSDGLVDGAVIAWLHLPPTSASTVPGLVHLTMDQVRSLHAGLTKLLESQAR